jgi:DNA helicase-2/ATP-dependent DNA helicase PcrA
MFQFQKDYTNATEIHLSVNYRSTPQIVQLSKNLISHNSYRFKKNSVAFEKNGSEPDLRQFKTQSEELRYVCMKIKEYIKSGIRADEIAILLRNNSQISGVREFLQNEMISTHSLKGGNSIYKGMVAKDIIAYVKAALSITSIPLRENENLIYILNKPQRFISRQVIGQEGMDFQGLMRVYSHNTEILKNIERLRFHMNMIACLNPSAAIIYIRNGTEYERYLRQYARERNIKVENLIKQLDEIQNDVSKFSTLKEWLEYTESQQVVPEEIRNHDMVQIMTMHGSKGLEFRVVFILDANQGIIPSSRSVRERDYQEERRVFYVAMTRAAEKLHIYGVIKSLGCPMEISMFVAESLEKYAEKG